MHGAFGLDPHTRDTEKIGCAPRDPCSLIDDVRAAQELGGDVREESRLALAVLGLRGAMARPGGKSPNRDRRRDVDRQREPVASVRRWNVWYGGKKKKLKASMLATAVAIP